MGRSFESVRQGVKEVSARWLKASKALKKEDQVYGLKLSEMAKKHSSEAFYALDDPLEAAVFSVLLEMVKEMAKANCKNDENGIESTSFQDPDLLFCQPVKLVDQGVYLAICGLYPKT